MSLFKKKEQIPPHPEKKPLFNDPLTPENLKKAFGGADDLTERVIRPRKGTEMRIFFLDGLVSTGQISESVVRPLMACDGEDPRKIMESVVWNLNALERDSIDDCAADLVNGCAVLVFEGRALSFEAKGGDKRPVTEPSIENVVKGAKEGFVETLRTNTGLVRRRIRTPQLRFRSMTAGRRTRTQIEVLYIEGVTNMRLVDDVEKRIRAMDVDGVSTATVLEEELVKGIDTAFPLVMYTDLCDRFCAGLLAGRVGVLAQGIPLGYLLPATFPQLMKAPEDDANNYIVASMIRLLRYVGFVMTLLLPGFYAAIATFHQEMIPYALMKAIVQSKQNVPFSSAVEVIGMLVAFEVLQEAGLRLPKNIGQTVSIIGALIVGQSAVEAKIFSPVVVIVVALAGVTGYMIPNQDLSAAVRIWRFVFTVAAMLLGMYGLALVLTVLLYHLASIETFGVPYLAPFVGAGDYYTVRRTIFRALKKNTPLRPKELRTQDKRAQN